jgi:hypothetical protein
MNGFAGIYEVDFKIIMDLWFQKKHTDSVETDNTLKVAIITMINLYNTCHYFRNLLDDPIYFQQFQVKVGYKMFDRFGDINSLNELIKSLPITTKKGYEELTKLQAGNVVSISFGGKNYRVIEAADSHGRMIEIDAKGIIIDNQIIKIFSIMVDQTYSGDNGACISQKWFSLIGDRISNECVCVKTKCGRSAHITGIDNHYIRTVVPS